MEKKTSGNVRQKQLIRRYFRVGESVNLDEIRNWVEECGDNFTDNFAVDDSDLIKKNQKGKGNENVMENQIIVREGENEYVLMAEEDFNTQYEEYIAEEAQQQV